MSVSFIARSAPKRRSPPTASLLSFPACFPGRRVVAGFRRTSIPRAALPEPRAGQGEVSVGRGTSRLGDALREAETVGVPWVVDEFESHRRNTFLRTIGALRSRRMPPRRCASCC